MTGDPRLWGASAPHIKGEAFSLWPYIGAAVIVALIWMGLWHLI